MVDEQGIHQAIAVIQEVELYHEGERFPAIAIESICNAPWNVIDKTQLQTRKGAPTSLIEFIVKESQSKQFAGVVKLFTIPRASEKAIARSAACNDRLLVGSGLGNMAYQ